MADIILARPQAGATQTVPAAAKARYVMQFPTDQATMERPEGSDDLIFRFDDGSVIELKDFYKLHTKEDMPEFETDEGQLIAGADFFQAFGPDLMPAAGNESPQGGHYEEYASGDLMDGVDALSEGLDVTIAGETTAEGAALSETPLADAVPATSEQNINAANSIFVASKSANTEPAAQEPVINGPTEPANTEPATQEPVVTGPTEPANTEPAAQEPVVDEPSTPEPANTEPAPQEPVVDGPSDEGFVRPVTYRDYAYDGGATYTFETMDSPYASKVVKGSVTWDADGVPSFTRGAGVGEAKMVTKASTTLKTDVIGLGMTGGNKDNIEMDYSAANGGQAVAFDLDEVAHGVNVELALFFKTGAGNGDEKGEAAEILLYRDGVLVGHKSFESTSADGYQTLHLDSEAGFDRVVITPADNGSPADNSDFLIKSVNIERPAATATGAAAEGAAFSDGVLEDSGIVVKASEDGMSADGSLDGKPVFHVELNGNGTWTATRYVETDAAVNLGNGVAFSLAAPSGAPTVTIDDNRDGCDHEMGLAESGNFTMIPVAVSVDEDSLKDGDKLTIYVNDADYEFTWENGSFGGHAGFKCEGGTISWNQTEIPGWGKKLYVTAEVTRYDGIGDAHIVSATDWSQRAEGFDALGTGLGLSLEKVGAVRGYGNYLAKGADWEHASAAYIEGHGTVANDGLANIGLTYEIDGQGKFEAHDNGDGTVTLTNVAGAYSGLAAGMLTVTYNKATGEYDAQLDKMFATSAKTFTINLTATAHADGSDLSFGSHAMTLTLKGCNAAGVPSAEIADAEGSSGRIASTAPDAHFYAFHKGATNAEARNGQDDWAEYTAAQSLYTEANLAMWMSDYASLDTKAVLSGQWAYTGFLGAPKQDLYGSVVFGEHGLLTVDPDTGAYSYELYPDTVVPEGDLGETFHLVVTTGTDQEKGAFNIKDVTFTVHEENGQIVYDNGAPAKFGDAWADNAVAEITVKNAGRHGGTSGDDLIVDIGGDNGNKGDIWGGDGDDVIYGGTKVDVLHGEADNDVLYGGESDDQLYGGDGNDFLFGGRDNDQLWGDAGNDFLDGGKGSDKLYGGEGDDVMVYDSADALVEGGDGVDFLVGGGSVDALMNSGKIKGVEAAFELKDSSETDILDMGTLKKYGLGVEDGKVSVDASQWTVNEEASTDDFVVFDHAMPGGESDAEVAVAKAALSEGAA